jgi:Ni/Co efflux regulator RcnB
MPTAVVSLVTTLVLGSAVALSSDFSASAAPGVAIDVEVVFTAEEIRLIRAHYQSHGHHGKGNGKRKHKGLPPGIAKNLARGKALPPGIAKQVLPFELRLALPPVREGYERVIVDGKVLLVEIATRIVHDVLTDIVVD